MTKSDEVDQVHQIWAQAGNRLFGQGDSCFFKGGTSIGARDDYNTIRGSYIEDGDG
jgi:hypothetical protein